MISAGERCIAFEAHELQVVVFLGVKSFPTVFGDLISSCVLCESGQNHKVAPLQPKQILDRKHLCFPLLLFGALVLWLGISLQRSASGRRGEVMIFCVSSSRQRGFSIIR